MLVYSTTGPWMGSKKCELRRRCGQAPHENRNKYIQGNSEAKSDKKESQNGVEVIPKANGS